MQGAAWCQQPVTGTWDKSQNRVLLPKSTQKMGRFPIPIYFLGLQQDCIAWTTMEMWQKCSWVYPVLFQPEIAGWTLAGHGKLEILKFRVGCIKSSWRGWGENKANGWRGPTCEREPTGLEGKSRLAHKLIQIWISVLYIKHNFAMGLGHVIVLPSRQSPNSVGASKKVWELLSSRAGTSGLPQAVPGAQLFLHGGQISELSSEDNQHRG